MATPNANASAAVLQLFAGMQAVETLRQQNEAARQSLVAQLHQLSAQSEASQAAAGGLAQAAAQAAAAAAAARSAEAAEETKPEVPRCHLHKKQNKACKFCKAFYEWQDQQTKKKEERKNAAIERLRQAGSSNSGQSLGQNDKAPLPNLPNFPQVMMERIQRNDYFNTTLANLSMQDMKGILVQAETCDTEKRAANSLDLEPSAFICTVYRMLTLQLTEGQLQGMLNHRSPWIRCAGFMYIRWGMHHERYWELLSDFLMDDEEFVPFPGRGGESMSVGQFVEQLLTKDKYCDLTLPRIPVAHKKQICRRIVLYDQFRRRYAANLEVEDKFEKAGIPVEICSVDGEWSPAETTGILSTSQHCTMVQVRPPEGGERDVSLGMIITVTNGVANNSSTQDLTTSRGRSSEELMQRYEEQQRCSAVASGKDYCKTSGQHTVRVGGVPFVAGVKRKELETERRNEAEENAQLREAKRINLEQQAKLAAIESKYLARVSTSRSDSNRDVDGPDRMRLG